MMLSGAETVRRLATFDLRGAETVRRLGADALAPFAPKAQLSSAEKVRKFASNLFASATAKTVHKAQDAASSLPNCDMNEHLRSFKVGELGFVVESGTEQTDEPPSIDAVRTALEDRGWVYAPEEAVELMLYYENPDDGTWFPLTDGAYINIFSKLDIPRPKLQLRPKKTLPTKVEPVDTKNPPGPKFGGTLGGPGPGEVKRLHVNGRWQRVRSQLPAPWLPFHASYVLAATDMSHPTPTAVWTRLGDRC